MWYFIYAADLRINFSLHKYLNVVQKKNSFDKFIFKIRIATWRHNSAAEHAYGTGFHRQYHKKNQTKTARSSLLKTYFLLVKINKK